MEVGKSNPIRSQLVQVWREALRFRVIRSEVSVAPVCEHATADNEAGTRACAVPSPKKITTLGGLAVVAAAINVARSHKMINKPIQQPIHSEYPYAQAGCPDFYL